MSAGMELYTTTMHGDYISLTAQTCSGRSGLAVQVEELYALETAVDLVSEQPENEVASSYYDDCDRYSNYSMYSSTDHYVLYSHVLEHFD